MSVIQVPNGEQVFLDNNGVPLALGTVGMYIPTTLTLKDTWKDPDQAALNINPIPLDAAGRAVIWGAGEYRQILKDQLGNTIWDKVVAAGTGQEVYWGGLSSGAPNAQILTVPGFQFVDGAVINWIAFFENTGPLFVDVNGAGGVQVFANSDSGAVPLIGGEVQAGNIISMVADTGLGGFRILSGTTGTRNLNVIGTFARSGQLTPAAMTVDTDDYDPPGIEDNSVLRISSTVPISLSGIKFTGVPGAIYTIDNVGSQDILFLPNSLLSAPGNRFLLNTSLTLSQNDSLEIHYDDTAAGWRVIPPAKAVAASRRVLTSDETIWVRTDGSDSNNGSTNTAGGAVLTWQKAVDIAASLDFNGFQVVCRCAQLAVSFPVGAVIPPMVGQEAVDDFVIRGDVALPSNILISTVAQNCFTMEPGARCRIEGFRFQVATSGRSLEAPFDSTMEMGNCEFGAIPAGIGATTYGAHMVAIYGGSIIIVGDYAITALTGAYHMVAEFSGKINILAITGTLSGTPVFSVFARSLNGTIMSSLALGYSGAATGTRYSASFNGLIFTGGAGATFFPGSIAGTTSTGGLYQ